MNGRSGGNGGDRGKNSNLDSGKRLRGYAYFPNSIDKCIDQLSEIVFREDWGERNFVLKNYIYALFDHCLDNITGFSTFREGDIQIWMTNLLRFDTSSYIYGIFEHNRKNASKKWFFKGWKTSDELSSMYLGIQAPGPVHFPPNGEISQLVFNPRCSFLRPFNIASLLSKVFQLKPDLKITEKGLEKIIDVAIRRAIVSPRIVFPQYHSSHGVQMLLPIDFAVPANPPPSGAEAFLTQKQEYERQQLIIQQQIFQKRLLTYNTDFNSDLNSNQAISSTEVSNNQMITGESTNEYGPAPIFPDFGPIPALRVRLVAVFQKTDLTQSEVEFYRSVGFKHESNEALKPSTVYVKADGEKSLFPDSDVNNNTCEEVKMSYYKLRHVQSVQSSFWRARLFSPCLDSQWLKPSVPLTELYSDFSLLPVTVLSGSLLPEYIDAAHILQIAQQREIDATVKLKIPEGTAPSAKFSQPLPLSAFHANQMQQNPRFMLHESASTHNVYHSANFNHANNPIGIGMANIYPLSLISPQIGLSSSSFLSGQSPPQQTHTNPFLYQQQQQFGVSSNNGNIFYSSPHTINNANDVNMNNKMLVKAASSTHPKIQNVIINASSNLKDVNNSINNVCDVPTDTTVHSSQPILSPLPFNHKINNNNNNINNNNHLGNDPLSQSIIASANAYALVSTSADHLGRLSSQSDLGGIAVNTSQPYPYAEVLYAANKQYLLNKNNNNNKMIFKEDRFIDNSSVPSPITRQRILLEEFADDDIDYDEENDGVLQSSLRPLHLSVREDGINNNSNHNSYVHHKGLVIPTSSQQKSSNTLIGGNVSNSNAAVNIAAAALSLSSQLALSTSPPQIQLHNGDESEYNVASNYNSNNVYSNNSNNGNSSNAAIVSNSNNNNVILGNASVTAQTYSSTSPVNHNNNNTQPGGTANNNLNNSNNVQPLQQAYSSTETSNRNFATFKSHYRTRSYEDATHRQQLSRYPSTNLAGSNINSTFVAVNNVMNNNLTNFVQMNSANPSAQLQPPTSSNHPHQSSLANNFNATTLSAQTALSLPNKESRLESPHYSLNPRAQPYHAKQFSTDSLSPITSDRDFNYKDNHFQNSNPQSAMIFVNNNNNGALFGHGQQQHLNLNHKSTASAIVMGNNNNNIHNSIHSINNNNNDNNNSTVYNGRNASGDIYGLKSNYESNKSFDNNVNNNNNSHGFLNTNSTNNNNNIKQLYMTNTTLNSNQFDIPSPSNIPYHYALAPPPPPLSNTNIQNNNTNNNIQNNNNTLNTGVYVYSYHSTGHMASSDAINNNNSMSSINRMQQQQQSSEQRLQPNNMNIFSSSSYNNNNNINVPSSHSKRTNSCLNVVHHPTSTSRHPSTTNNNTTEQQPRPELTACYIQTNENNPHDSDDITLDLAAPSPQDDSSRSQCGVAHHFNSNNKAWNGEVVIGGILMTPRSSVHDMDGNNPGGGVTYGGFDETGHLNHFGYIGNCNGTTATINQNLDPLAGWDEQNHSINNINISTTNNKLDEYNDVMDFSINELQPQQKELLVMQQQPTSARNSKNLKDACASNRTSNRVSFSKLPPTNCETESVVTSNNNIINTINQVV